MVSSYQEIINMPRGILQQYFSTPKIDLQNGIHNKMRRVLSHKEEEKLESKNGLQSTKVGLSHPTE